MEVPRPDEVRSVLDCLNSLRSEVLWVTVFIVIAVIAFLVIKLLIHRNTIRTVEEAKNKRAQLHVAALNKLAQSLDVHTRCAEEQNARILLSLGNLNTVVVRLEDCVDVMLERVTGELPKSDSLKLIRDKLYGQVRLDICIAVGDSLRENDFAGRKDFVTRKVKTRIGVILAEARAFLLQFHLAADVQKFFITTEGSGGERFVLCEDIWTGVAPLFLRECDNAPEAQHKIEEMRLLVMNTINDYYNKCVKRGVSHVNIVPVQQDSADAAGV